jgi:ABC-type multidrug transport system fused ATPase/permease subunit
LRYIGSRWRNLADGLLRIETLEARLLTEWGQRLDKAHKERQEAARQRALRQGRATLISALVVALLMLALSIFLLKLASPAATIVLRLAFLLSTVLAICGVLFLLRNPDPTRVRMNLPDVWLHIIPKHDASIRRSGSTLAALRRSGRRVVRLLPLRCLVKGVRRSKGPLSCPKPRRGRDRRRSDGFLDLRG